MVNAFPKIPVNSMDNILNYQERKNEVTLQMQRVEKKKLKKKKS